MKVAPTSHTIVSAKSLTAAQRRAALKLGNQLVPNNVPELLHTVAVANQKVVGVLYADAKEQPAIIHVVAVDPQHQRQGIAYRLVADFEAKLAQRGITEFEVDCNTEASQKLFEKFDYTFNGKHGCKPAWEVANGLA
jgi:ribosomal protein S18 acetylase RimI-like enzyme